MLHTRSLIRKEKVKFLIAKSLKYTTKKRNLVQTRFSEVHRTFGLNFGPVPGVNFGSELNCGIHRARDELQWMEL